MSRINLSIDLTPSNTTIFREGKGIVLDEPNKILCQNEYDAVRILAYGSEAVKFQLDQFLIYPITSEAIYLSEQYYARQMLKNFVSKVITDKPSANIHASFLVSCGTTVEYKKYLQSLAFYAGISEVNFVPYPLADLVGCGISFKDFTYCLIVDINHNNTDVAVLSKKGILDAVSINFGTQSIDAAIYEQVQYRYGVSLNEESIQEIKTNLARLERDSNHTLSFEGQDIKSMLNKTVKISSVDIFDAIKEYFVIIANTINQLALRQTPDVQEALFIQGVIFCGRGSSIQSLSEFMQKRMDMPVFVASYDCTMFGLGKLASNRKLYKKIS